MFNSLSFTHHSSWFLYSMRVVHMYTRTARLTTKGSRKAKRACWSGPHKNSQKKSDCEQILKNLKMRLAGLNSIIPQPPPNGERRRRNNNWLEHLNLFLVISMFTSTILVLLSPTNWMSKPRMKLRLGQLNATLANISQQPKDMQLGEINSSS